MSDENISMQLADIFVSAVGDAVSEISAGLGLSELLGELSGTARISAEIFGNEFLETLIKSAAADTGAGKTMTESAVTRADIYGNTGDINSSPEFSQMYKNFFSYPMSAEYSEMYRAASADNVSANSAGFASEDPFSARSGFSGNTGRYDRIVLNADIDLTTFLDGKVIAENTAEYIREFNRRSDGYGE